ncbi:MAG: sugar phosphate isomerase/epimerase [Candidatus Atribacteria bacterium]|nr:sugar phosphate isomerase/epimerase [Candidatus Atribacteria bacterium]
MFKLGFVSAIFADLSFEEVIIFASNNGYTCVEILCWPKGKAERRYAGVTHIDVNELDEMKINSIKKYAAEKNVEISALGYYPNPLDPDLEKREYYIEHLKGVIAAAAKLGLKNVNTFIGKDKNKNLEDNFQIFRKVWPAIIKYAEENSVKIGIENCPMFFTNDEWPGGNNLATTPSIWKRMFEEINSDNFGLNYDPSHLLWQQIDYIKPIYEFKDKIFHVHIKDVKIYRDKLDQVGVLATPLEFHSPKLPGLGEINWGKFISALTDIGYQGCACVEVEDRSFEDSLESRKNSLILSRQYLRQFIV